MKKIILLSMALIAQNLFGTPTVVPDPSLITQRLQNGLTIAVFRNTEPPNRVSMRLLVKRGSAYETPAELGIAHFIEHMAFNGTKHFPAGDMVEYFQRLGMAFGADTNAHTGFTETVYKLDMPEVSQKLTDDGLLLLRDYADSILFEDSAIDRERGVILAEKDSRDSQDYRKAVKEIGHYFKGSIFADRMPIGEKSVIEKLHKSDFKKFYEATYRPENMTVVIVGDIDPKKTLAEAVKYFGDMKGSPLPARIANFGNLETSDFKFDFSKTPPPVDAVYHSTSNTPKAYAAISVAKELNGRPDNLEKRVNDCRVRALTTAMTARYLRVADLPNSKISQGSAADFDFDGYCRVISLNAEAPVGKAADALEENFRQLESLKNLTDAEIDAAKKKIYESAENQIKAKSTRTSRELANDIVSAFSEGDNFTSPESDLEIAKYALSNFTARDAVELLKSLLSGAKFKVFVSDSTAEIPQESLKKMCDSAFKTAAATTYAPETFSSEKLKFSNFGAEGKIVSEKYLKDLQITQLEFSNGIRVNLKHTDFAKDEILMKISFGNGILDIPVSSPEYFTGIYALVAGGTKFQDASTISAARFMMKMGVSVGVDGNNFAMTGGSTVKDFEPMIKYAATMFLDAGYREDGMSAMHKYAEAFYLDYETSPMSQLRFLPIKMISAPVAEIPGTLKAFDSLKMSQIKDWFEPILKKSYMEISIVGDIDVEKTKTILAQTFGTMPQRQSVKKEPFANLQMKPYGDSFKLVYRTSDEPRSIAAVMWPSCGRDDTAKMRVSNILGAVLDDVLRKEIREKRGKVYSPFAYNNSSVWIKGFGLMTAMTAVIPSDNAELIEALKACGLKAAENISEDDFKRAKIPLLKSVEANKRKNEYWLGAVLNLSQAIPQNIELARTIDTGYNAVTLDEVRLEARKIFERKPYSASVMPVSDK